MRKINLLLNKSFKTFDFNDSIDDSIYSSSTDNLLKYSVSIVLENKPTTNTDYVDIDKDETINCYLFPFFSSNHKFSIGDVLYTHKNDAVFVITAHISENLFTLQLIDIKDGGTYSLKNTTNAILHNKLYEKYIINNNDIREIIASQKNEYTNYINSNNDFVTYLLEQFQIESTDSTITTTFDFQETSDSILFTNIINKFYLNI
jgi:hypothetical protein